MLSFPIILPLFVSGCTLQDELELNQVNFDWIIQAVKQTFFMKNLFF